MIVDEITPEFMEKIDIVAASSSTMLYQLLPYKKAIWVLDTEGRYLDVMVEDGYAHKVKYNDLDCLDEKNFLRTIVDTEYFFHKEKLRETLIREVLSYETL